MQGIENVKVVALLLCIASGLSPISCNGCIYKFTKLSTCQRDEAAAPSLDVIITSHLVGPQNNNIITVSWYKRNREDISNWELVNTLPTKYQNPYYSRDLGNGTIEIDTSLKILHVSETDSGCYVCEVCVTYVQCAPSDTADPSNVRCLRGFEQCLDASSALLCSGSTGLGLPAPPQINVSAAVSPSPGITSNGGGGGGGGGDGAASAGGVMQMALYGGIAVCIVLALTAVLLTIVVIVLCANKNTRKKGTRKPRGKHGDKISRAVVGTGYRNPAGDTLLTFDGTLSSSGASSSSSDTLLTVPSFNGALTLSPNAHHADESTFNMGPHHLPQPNQYSGASNCAPAGIIPADHSAHLRSPRENTNPQSMKDDGPGAPRIDSPSSVLSPGTGLIHHYHVLELRPVSEVGSDTSAQTREDSWGAIAGPSALHHQGHHERALEIVSQSRHCECAESAHPPEKGVEAPPQSAAVECCRYTKLDVSTLSPKHDYVKRSIMQADPAQPVDAECTH